LDAYKLTDDRRLAKRDNPKLESRKIPTTTTLASPDAKMTIPR